MQLGAPKAKLVDAGDIVEQMRWVKDQEEIGVMRRSIYFADYTVKSGPRFHRSQRQRHRRGDPESDRGRCGQQDVEGADLRRRRRDERRPSAAWFPSASAQLSHTPFPARTAKKGDALILSFGATVGGYNVECERAFCVGQPSDYAKRLYDAMLAAHDTGART